jgi:hypothetical protein
MLTERAAHQSMNDEKITFILFIFILKPDWTGQDLSSLKKKVILF